MDSEAVDFCGGRGGGGFAAGFEEFLVEGLDQFGEGGIGDGLGEGVFGVGFQVLEEGLAALGLERLLHMAVGIGSGAGELLLQFGVWVWGVGEECESVFGEDICIPGGAEVLGEPFEFGLQLEGMWWQEGFEELEGCAEASAGNADLVDGFGCFLESGEGFVGEEAGGFLAEDFPGQVEEWGAVFFARFHLGEGTPQCSSGGARSAKR